MRSMDSCGYFRFWQSHWLARLEDRGGTDANEYLFRFPEGKNGDVGRN